MRPTVKRPSRSPEPGAGPTDLREFHEVLPSTQRRALELARAGAVYGTRVVAARQTRGHGRLDHRWASPAGGLYLSVLLPVGSEPSTLLPLAIGAQLAEDLDARWSIGTRLKWPNDLLVVRGPASVRKLSGILVDTVERPGEGRVAVAGIGVNVRRLPADVATKVGAPTVALEELVSRVPAVREVEEVAVEAALRASRDIREPAGRAAVLARCGARLYGVGRRAEVDGVAAGIIRGLAADGALRLDHEGQPMTIRAGDLRVLDP
jgi:BirA family transcriptional regulator, biotin operon repressor / biotin---[acetyl-CoA-carboxylase] ligase